MEAIVFFDTVRELCVANKRADAIDLAYDTIDDLCLAKNFEPVAAILERAIHLLNVDANIPTSIYLSILTITRPWHEQFEAARVKLGTMLFNREAMAYGHEYARELLGGLVKEVS